MYQVLIDRILIPSHLQGIAVSKRQAARYLAGGPLGRPFDGLLHAHVRQLPQDRFLLLSGARRVLIARAGGLRTVNVTLEGDEADRADAALAIMDGVWG